MGAIMGFDQAFNLLKFSTENVTYFVVKSVLVLLLSLFSEFGG